MHTYDQRPYFRAAYLAEYYLWYALRGMPPVGNCPITGKRYRVGVDTRQRACAVQMNKAAARFWLAEARNIRKAVA